MQGDSKIITDLPPQTPRQASSAVRPAELPECAANPGAGCTTAATDFMIKGYDDKHRCKRCNDLHVELVMQEAGESAPNSEPQFVSPKLDRRAESERLARIEAMNKKLAKGSGIVTKEGVATDGQTQGPTGIPAAVSNTRPLQAGEAADMKDAMAKDEFGTRDSGLSDEERRTRIFAKYRKQQSKE